MEQRLLFPRLPLVAELTNCFPVLPLRQVLECKCYIDLFI